jgi:hypothetical protein
MVQVVCLLGLGEKGHRFKSLLLFIFVAKISMGSPCIQTLERKAEHFHRHLQAKDQLASSVSLGAKSSVVVQIPYTPFI